MSELEYMREWGSRMQDEMEHQARLAMEWRDLARDAMEVLGQSGTHPKWFGIRQELSARFAAMEKSVNESGNGFPNVGIS